MAQTLTPEQKRILANILFAEVGGGSIDEAKAVASTFLNNLDRKGFNHAARMSSAYLTRSKQYKLAESGEYAKNAFEANAFNRNAAILENLLSDPKSRGPYTNFENVKQYGEPYWAAGQTNYRDIGRQRFYTIQENPRARVVAKSQ